MHKWPVLLGFLLCAFSLVAQKPFEGRIHYSVNYLSFPDGMEGAELALPQQMTLVLNGANYRMQQASALAGDLVWIRPDGGDTLYQLFDFMDRKVFLAIPTGKGAAKYRIVPKEGELTLAGVECSRRFAQDASGEHKEIWVWERYKNPLTNDFPSLKSLPLQFDMERNGIRMRFSAERIVEEPIDQTYFTIPSNAVRIDEGILQRIMN
ncbi:MAG: hypothetical protein HQ500_11925 [Flavobacteriales bacterium]|nr:hypothetical protein [Flavobacteriales bacterium]